MERNPCECLLNLVWMVAWWVSAGGLFAADTSTDDSLRLDVRVRPVAQSLRLELDPWAETYRGVARVDLRFGLATNRFRFHALEIDLGPATLDGMPLTLAREEAGIVSATSGGPTVVGDHVLEIVFTNNFNLDGTGLSKTVWGGKPYLFTQMEPTDARRAFPCWDEPAFKIPWRMTLAVPAGNEVVGNMPVAQVSEKEGTRVFEFGRTPPMPSYLVAIAVGTFEFLPIPAQAIPGRIVTVAGKSELGRRAAEEAPVLLTALERYFGIPHPFPKLDHLALPGFNGGAMENAGAITYLDSLLLVARDRVSVDQERALIEVLTHEMAHMWFGNLVTMEWWDDLWLNEAFATWLSYKIAGEVHPELRFDLETYGSMRWARLTDAQPSVKAIRRPFRGGENLNEAFDALSYLKGQAILGMIESWIGPKPFQAALKRYFDRHAWGNTRADDLWDAFAEAGDRTLRETLRRYLEQPGIPVITVSKVPGDRLRVSQRRYRDLVTTNVVEHLWQVPMIVRYGDTSGSRTVKLLLTKEADVFEVPGLDQALWIQPNAGESGYYRWSLTPEILTGWNQWGPLPSGTVERLGLLDAAEGALASGDLPADSALRLLMDMARDPEMEIRFEVADGITRFRNYIAVEDHPGFARLVRMTLRPILEDLGLEPQMGETPARSRLRGKLLEVMGITGEDPAVIEFCQRRAARQLADSQAVAPSIANEILRVATWHGDAEWFARIRKAFEQAQAPDVRMRFLGVLAGFRDPELVRTGLEYLLTSHVQGMEMLRLVAGGPDSAQIRFEWLVNRYEAVRLKAPEPLRPYLTMVLTGGGPELMERGRAFFLDPTRRDARTEVELTKLTELSVRNAALRTRNREGLARYIRAWNVERTGP